MQELDDIAEKVRRQEWSYERGVNAILELVYTNTARFQLSKLNADSLHDFLLLLRPKLYKFLKQYNPSLGSFSAFFYPCLKRAVHSWKKHAANMNAAEESLSIVYGVSMEEKQYAYQESEESLVCEQCDEAPYTADARKQSSQEDLAAMLNGSGRSERRPRFKSPDEKMDALRKAACLISALKASYYLDGTMMEKVSRLTGVPEQELKAMTDQVKASMASRIQKRDRCLTCRDNAFFFYRKYLMARKRLMDDSCALSQTLKKKRDKRIRSWKEKNRMLKTESYMVIPTDKQVAEVLRMKNRRLRYILNSAEQNIDKISPKRYHGTYEHISGDRKPEQKAGDDGTVSRAYHCSADGSGAEL